MKSFSLKLSHALLCKLEGAAQARGQSKSELLRQALEQYLETGPAGPAPVSALDLAGDLVGCWEGPGDLSTNPKHLEGYGK